MSMARCSGSGSKKVRPLLDVLGGWRASGRLVKGVEAVGSGPARQGTTSDQAVEDGAQTVEPAQQVVLGFRDIDVGTACGQDMPSGGVLPILETDGDEIAAVADVGVADQHVGDLDRGDDADVPRRLLGVVMISGCLDEDFGQSMISEVEGAQFGVIDAQNGRFDFAEIATGIVMDAVDGGEMIGKGGGHGDPADIMNQSGDVVGVIRGRLEHAGDLLGQDCGADAVFPEFTPGEPRSSGEHLEVVDDGGHHGEAPDLADADIEDGFLDAVDGGGKAVVNGVDEAQKAGGQTGVTPNDFCDLRRVALVCAKDFAQGNVDGTERRQSGTARNATFDLWHLQPGQVGWRRCQNFSHATGLIGSMAANLNRRARALGRWRLSTGHRCR